jgi:desulfoferrodoxin-like iron-binding protein
MPTKKKAKKKAKPRKKTRKAARKPAKRKPRRRVAIARPAKPAGPHYSCILCGVEVDVSKAGLGISRLMCCGQPMERR